MEQITINLDIEKAKKLSKAIFNIAIQNFFDFSMALNDFCEFDSLLELNDLMIHLKSLIDEQLDKTY